MTGTKIKKEEKDLQELLANMDATTYRLNLLCNRFEKDKDVILKEGVDIKHAVKTLQTEIAAFSKMRGEIAEILSRKIEQASEAIARAAGEDIKGALKINMEGTVYQLDEAVRRAKDKFQFFYDLDRKRIWQMAVLFILLPVVASFLVVKLAMPKPVNLNVDGKTCAVFMQESRGYWGY